MQPVTTPDAKQEFWPPTGEKKYSNSFCARINRLHPIVLGVQQRSVIVRGGESGQLLELATLAAV